MNTEARERSTEVSPEVKEMADNIITQACTAYWKQYREMLEAVGQTTRVPLFGEMPESHQLLHKACMMHAILAAKDLLGNVAACDHGIALSEKCPECTAHFQGRDNPPRIVPSE